MVTAINVRPEWYSYYNSWSSDGERLCCWCDSMSAKIKWYGTESAILGCENFPHHRDYTIHLACVDCGREHGLEW